MKFFKERVRSFFKKLISKIIFWRPHTNLTSGTPGNNVSGMSNPFEDRLESIDKEEKASNLAGEISDSGNSCGKLEDENIDNSQAQDLTQSKIFSPESEALILPNLNDYTENEINQDSTQDFRAEISKPKRSRSPSFQTNEFLEKDLVIDEIEEDDDDILGEDIEINLADPTSRHLRLQRTIKTPQNVDDLEDKQRERRARIKHRPKVMFDLEKGKMLLKLPIIAFSQFKLFNTSIPISCIITITNLQENMNPHTIELREQNCHIKNYEEIPIFINLDLFKSFRCRIQTSNREIQRNYYFLHEDENIFIFLQKKESNILLYKFKSFFEETDMFWILLKNNLKLTPDPISIYDNLVYSNYNLFNIGFNSEDYEIQIIDQNNNLLVSLFKEPKIAFSSQKREYVFDEFYYEEPLFWTNFSVLLECSDILKGYPKLVHLQNSISYGYMEQEEFYKRIEWKEGDRFEITPEDLNNKIGSFQIDVDFYKDRTYTEKLFDKSIRALFRYCPLLIVCSDSIILPSENGHEDLNIHLITANNQLLSIERSEIDFKTELIENGIKMNKFSAIVPKILDQFEFVIRSPLCKNLVRIRPYIPRVKWRLKNLEKFESLSDTPLIFDFDNDFDFKKNLTLEIRIISKDCINDLLIMFDDKKFALKISNDKKFIYPFPLNTIYEEIQKYIKNQGKLHVYLIINGKKILVMNIFGEKGVYFEHIKPKRKRLLSGDHSERIKLYYSFINELKIHGYRNSRGNRVISAVITILSKEEKYTLDDLREKFFHDRKFNEKVNSFLMVNNIIPNSKMTYQEFINGLWDTQYRFFEEILEYLENN